MFCFTSETACIKCVKGIIYKVIKLKTSFTLLLDITFKVSLFTQFIQKSKRVCLYGLGNKTSVTED